MKTSRKAYVVAVQYECSQIVFDVLVFTNHHAALMCANQYNKRPGCGFKAEIWTRYMVNGRADLSGV
jgi:hypothetical protein